MSPPSRLCRMREATTQRLPATTASRFAVNLPNHTNFINGGGFLVNTASSGTYAGIPGQKTHFGFNVKFNKGGTNLQGNANIIISSNGRTYQIKTTSITSLGVMDTTQGGYGSFLSKANIQDITDPLNPISIEGNDSLTIPSTTTERLERTTPSASHK
jgi:hypothetical protein